MMSAERGAGANTLAAYARDLADFAAFAKDGIAAASRDEIRAYLTQLSSAGLAASSQARRLSALRQFYGFLYAEDIRKDNPTEAVEAPKTSRPLPKILSTADMEAMIAAAAAEDSPEAKRLTCIVEMLYAAGLRVSELAGLPLAAVKNKDGFHPGQRKRQQGAAGATERIRARGDKGLSGRPRGVSAQGPAARPCRALPVLLSRGGRLHDPPEALPVTERLGGESGSGSRQGLAPCPASRLRHPSGGRRRGFALGADAIGPCRHRHDGNLYPCRQGSSEESDAQGAPPGPGAKAG